MTSKLRGLESGNVWDYENGFYWFSGQGRLGKLLAHYELYKKIIDLPGEVAEFGVFKGASFTRFCTFRSLFEGETSRKIFGFDAFGKFPTVGLEIEEDLDFIEGFEGAGGDGLSDVELEALLVEKGIGNFELVKGNVFDTLPEFLVRNPAVRFSLLHLDMDVKEPTEFVLEHLYDRVVPGGILVFDDYGTVLGETIAVDDFVERKGLSLCKLPFYKIPAYVQKP